MRFRFKKWLLITPIAIGAFLLILIWAADSWLESPAGRARVEASLENALGMPVRLQKGFSVSLLPEPGVEGEGLEIGESGNDGLLLRCESFHASVSLWPLLHGELVVMAVRAADGAIDLNQIPAGDPDTPSPSIRLPRIDLLQLENFRIPMSGDEEMNLELHRLTLEGFQVGTASPLMLDGSLVANSDPLGRVTALTTLMLTTGPDQLRLVLNSVALEAAGQRIEGIEGSVNWDLSSHWVEARLEGGGPALGEASLAASYMTESQSGSLTMSFTPQGRNEPATAELAFQRQESGLQLSRISAEVADQRVTGDGCWVSEPDPALQVELTSDSIDLDRLQAWLPASEGKGEPAIVLPFGLRARLSAARVLSGDIIGHQVELAAGEPPDCTGMAD